MVKPDEIPARRILFAVIGLIALTVACFWRVGGHEFLRYDDPDYVTLNPHINQGLTAEGLAWAFGNVHGESTYWHPLTWVNHMIDCQFFGLRPGPHHLVNLAFHLANVTLLFLVILRMTGDFWPSALLAALWAVHPLQVDTVAWVTERKNLLSGLFWLLSMGAYLRYAGKPAPRRYLLIVLFMGLGLMTKPILVTLPCALLLLDFWPLQRLLPKSGTALDPARPDGVPRFPQFPLSRLLVEKLPLLVLSIASSAITIQAHAQLGSLGGSEFTLWLRIQNAAVSYARYLGKALMPTGLSVFYPHPGEWPASTVALSVGLLVAMTGAAIFLARRSPAIAVGWFWFLGVMVPAIGIVQAGNQSIADRFMYLPLLGLLIIAIWGCRPLLERLRTAGGLAGGLALGVVLALAATCSVQVRYWKNTSTLFAHALQVTENNYLAYGVMGTQLQESGQNTEAMAYLQQALKFQPNHYECRLALANSLSRLGRFEEALEQFAKAVQLNPRYADAFNDWAVALASSGHPGDALAKVDEALRLQPSHIGARLLRALLLQRLGRLDDAVLASHSALLLHPTNTATLLLLGSGFLGYDRAADALPVFQQVLAVNPDSVEALNRNAWVLATHRDARVRNGQEALRLATRACSLTQQRDPLSINTLAAAYAELGDFAAATAKAQQALQLLGVETNGPTVVIQKLLELYRSGTAYRE